MRYQQVLELLRDKKRVMVTGPARSGTAITTEILAHDLSLPCVREEEFCVDRPQKFFALVQNTPEFVVQAPCMSSFCHWLEDVTVVFMLRPIADIIRSQLRVEWGGEPLERSFYHAMQDPRPIAEIKYHHWHNWQQLILQENGLLLEYDSLAGHEMWLAAKQRETFAGRQTRIDQPDQRENNSKNWPVPREQNADTAPQTCAEAYQQAQEASTETGTQAEST